RSEPASDGVVVLGVDVSSVDVLGVEVLGVEVPGVDDELVVGVTDPGPLPVDVGPVPVLCEPPRRSSPPPLPESFGFCSLENVLISSPFTLETYVLNSSLIV